MSHTGKWVVIASARRPVGVDAERSGEQIALALIKLIAANGYEANWAADQSEGAARTLRLWLAKEARFKSAGNFQAHFEPQALAVFDAAGWHPNLRFERVFGLLIAVWQQNRSDAGRAKKTALTFASAVVLLNSAAESSICQPRQASSRFALLHHQYSNRRRQ